MDALARIQELERENTQLREQLRQHEHANTQLREQVEHWKRELESSIYTSHNLTEKG